MPTSRELRFGLITWSTLGFPHYFSPKTLVLPTGGLATVTPEDVHRANIALRGLTRRQLTKLPVTATEYERRLAILSGWHMQSHGNHQTGADLAPTTRLYTLVNWDQDQNSVVDWNWMVQWLAGQVGHQSWQADMSRCLTRMRRPKWWQQADRFRRVLDHQTRDLHLLPHHELVSRVQEVHCMSLQLRKKMEPTGRELSLDTELPWLSGSSKSLRKWCKRQSKKLSYQIKRIETNLTHTAPATLAVSASLGDDQPLRSEALLRWLHADDQARINGLLDVIDRAKPKQRARLLAMEDALEAVPISEWSRIAKSRLPKPELKRLLRENYNQPLERTKQVSIREQFQRTTGYRYWPYAGDTATKVVQKSWQQWAATWPKAVWQPEFCRAWGRCTSRRGRGRDTRPASGKAMVRLVELNSCCGGE